MTWYNPLSWFKGTLLPEQSVSSRTSYPSSETFYCANPQCNRAITEDNLAYEPIQRVVVHEEGDCQGLFFAWQAFNSTEDACGIFYVISRTDATDFVRWGEIDSRCLEKRV